MLYRLSFRLSDGAWYRGQKVTRLIDAPSSCTLEQLIRFLLDTLDFDFDHMYLFTIGRRQLEGMPPFGVSKSKRRLERLYSLGLKKGDTMQLVYDFGDDWTFQIKVEDTLQDTLQEPRLVKAQGNVEQYQDPDTWYEDGEDETFTWDYTAPDALYEAAFHYKKAKPWTRLSEEEVFAVRFSDGEIGYISVMGKIGQHCALSVWMGDEGLAALRRLQLMDFDANVYSEKEILYSQNCLQMVLDNQEYLNEKELSDAKAYGAAHGIRFAGKNAYPHFYRFEPYHHPWHPQDPKDELHLQEAMYATIQMVGCVKSRTVTLEPLYGWKMELPLLEEQLGVFHIMSNLSIPDYEMHTEPAPIGFDRNLAAELKKLPKRSSLECRLMMYPSPTQEDDEAPVYPMVLFAIDADERFALDPLMEEDYLHHPERLADGLMSALQDLGYQPRKILVRDNRTYQFLLPVVTQLKISMETVDSLPHIDQLIEEMFDENGRIRSPYGEDPFDDEEDDVLDSIIHMLLIMPASEVQQMPPALKMQILQMLESSQLPEEMAAEIRRKLKKP